MTHIRPPSLRFVGIAVLMGATILSACGGGDSGPRTDAGSTILYQDDPGPVVRVALASTGTTYHVRPDGGTADQCNGKSNVAYPGNGTALTCAWNSPMVALPSPGTSRIAGGDTLIIHNDANGSQGVYRIGYGSPGAVGCSTSFTWDCKMGNPPSGPDATHPTLIVGEGYDGSCAAAPQLYGAERVDQIFDLTGTKNIALACMEITDHANCIDSHTGGLACNRDTYPHGDWSSNGIYAVDSENVLLQDLDIHGLSSHGILAGRLKNWTANNVRIAANGWAGWDGDIVGDDFNTGTTTLRNVTIEWNGCSETWPGKVVNGCWGQTAGGYGDGLGTGTTGGDWLIEDSKFLHNTSDGLDLLYHRAGGKITINRVRAEGNAGNQIKASGNTSITNAVVLANCSFFMGKSFTHNVDSCRASGDAVSVGAQRSTEVIELINSTVVSEGNVVVLVNGVAGSQFRAINNILVGLPIPFYSPAENSADMYSDSGLMTFDDRYNTKFNLRHSICTGTGTVCGDPGLVSFSNADLDPHLKIGASARDSGLSSATPSVDFYGQTRPAGAGVDRGAVEMP